MHSSNRRRKRPRRKADERGGRGEVQECQKKWKAGKWEKEEEPKK